MRYASIRSMDISNGSGIGVSLFVQGCPFHCYNCFNPQTWDFDGGKEWTVEIEAKFFDMIEKSTHAQRVTIIGGEPLCDGNVDCVYMIVSRIKSKFPNKKIWLYTGYTWEYIKETESKLDVVSLCNIVVDGKYIDSLRDITLPFRGSSNQRLIDVQATLNNPNGEIVLWEP